MATGPKHKSKYEIGTIINNSFTILEEIYKEYPNKHYWMYRCKCNCGEIFECRQSVVDKRIGCKSCTASKSGVRRSIQEHDGIEQHGIKLRKYREYKKGADKRNLSFDLSFEQFLELSSGTCVYCGQKPHVYPGDLGYMQQNVEYWERNGIDRVDSNQGYHWDNCVPCCEKCNYAKHEMSLDDFKNWIVKIYTNLISSSTTIPAGSTLQANGSGNDEHPEKDEDIV